MALKESIPVYRKLEAIAMIVLIGENKEYNADNVYKCLLAAKPLLEEHDVTLLVEPLNTVDRSGYSMPYAAPVFELLRKINSPHIKMLPDVVSVCVPNCLHKDYTMLALKYGANGSACLQSLFRRERGVHLSLKSRCDFTVAFPIKGLLETRYICF